MAKDSADDILELMDIVEEGRIPDFTANPAKSGQSASFDDELDALFGDSEPGGGGSAAMDPNETLDMPDMSDIDSLLSDLDEEALNTSPGLELDEHVAGVDEMLDDLLPKASEPSFEQEADNTDFSGADDFDALLDEINSGDEFLAGKGAAASAKAPVSPQPISDEQDLDMMFAELDNEPEADSSPAASEEPDEFLDELDALFEPQPDAAGGAARENAERGPAISVGTDEQDDFDELFAAMEPEVEEKAAPAPADKTENEVLLEDLDALIDDIMAPGPAAAAVAAAPAAASSPVKKAAAPAAPAAPARPEKKLPEQPEASDFSIDELFEEEDILAEADSVPSSGKEEKVSPQEVAPSGHEEFVPAAAAQSAALSIEDLSEEDLETLSEQLLGGPLLATVHTLIIEEVENQVKKSGQADGELDTKLTAMEKRLDSKIDAGAARSMEAGITAMEGSLEAKLRAKFNSDMEAEFAALEERLEARFNAMLNEELETRLVSLESRLEARLNATADKAAASAAARIIREEIAALLQEL